MEETKKDIPAGDILAQPLTNFSDPILVGMDSSSSITDIKSFPVNPEFVEIGKVTNSWFTLLKSETLDMKAALIQGVKLLQRFASALTKESEGPEKQNADLAIEAGKTALAMKALARDARIYWRKYYEDYLTFIKFRSLQRFMRIARHQDCHKYSYIGVEALDCLCSMAEKSKATVEDFLKARNISEDTHSTVQQFKLAVEALRQRKPGGKKKGQKNFTSLSSTLTAYIDSIISDTAQLMQVDQASLTAVADKIQQLQKAITAEKQKVVA